MKNSLPVIGLIAFLIFRIFPANALRDNSRHFPGSGVMGQDQPTARIIAQPLLRKSGNGFQQMISVYISHLKAPATASVTGGEKLKGSFALHPGADTLECWTEAVSQATKLSVSLSIPGVLSLDTIITLTPVPQKFIYLISHSHNDIGYSDLQTVVEKEQNTYTREAMALIRETKDYPAGSRFKWNVESLWALENFFRVASDAEKKELIGDVKSGYIGLSAGYCNELTGICRPEELQHLTDYYRILHQRYGVVSRTYMISDVPGFSWAAIPSLASRGVRYVSSGPNYSDRIGYARSAWGDKPFYWVSSDKKDTLLFWEAGKGYSFFHNWIDGPVGGKTLPLLMEYLRDLDQDQYPYDMVQMRYTIVGDNHGPDPHLSDFVKAWNEKYVSPKLVIATVDEMMEKFERQYRKELPVCSGDFTPYWEDGAMSTAREETITKHAVERLIQAEALNRMLTPRKDNSNLFYTAWRDAVMWHEHTWGAWSSISRPDSSFTIEQWRYKQHFALAADSLSKEILSQWIHSGKPARDHIYRVYNTSGWERSGLVKLTADQTAAGNGIRDEQGHSYPAQRMDDGSLVFRAAHVRANGSKRFVNTSSKKTFSSSLRVTSSSLENEFLKVDLDPVTGAIRHLTDKKTGRDYVDGSKGLGMNEYLYVPGRDPAKAEKVNGVKIRITESGPLVATLEISSGAPGAEELIRDISLASGEDRVDITDKINKTKVRTKESVHFAFPVNVPGGKMRIDLGKGVLEPDINQLPGSNRDFTALQRWVDISNGEFGLTVVTRESPIIEIGEMVNEVTGKNRGKMWKTKTDLSNTFYFYVMNNYWHTNYKADQEGWVSFHYSLFPHQGGFDRIRSERQGISVCQPLLISAAGPSGKN